MSSSGTECLSLLTELLIFLNLLSNTPIHFFISPYIHTHPLEIKHIALYLANIETPVTCQVQQIQ